MIFFWRGDFPLAERGQRVVQPGLHRPEGDLEDLGDLAQLEPIGESEAENRLLQLAQAHEPVAHVRGKARQHGRLVGRAELVVVARSAPPIGCQVLDDGIQERRQPVPELEIGQLAQQIRKRLLHHVERILAVAAESERQCHDPIAVTPVEHLECRRVAAATGLDQLAVRREGLVHRYAWVAGMIEDLSQHHERVSDLFPPMAPEEAWERYQLSDDQVAFFEEHGYLTAIPVLSAEQVTALRAELAALMDPSHPRHELFYEFHRDESAAPDTVLFHALGAWRIEPGFHDLLWHPAFTVPATQLLGGPIRLWHDQLFCKPPHDGGVVAWHQDFSYWTRTAPMAHLSCWVGLDDSTRENGCLHYVPGSHRWDLLPITGLTGDMNAIRSILTEEQRRAFEPVPVELFAGEASFHHPLLVHGSFENRTPSPRRATVINVFRDGVESASDDSPLAGVPAIPCGNKMNGRFFPLLSDRTRNV